MTTYYDDRIDAISLHFYTSREDANECVKKTADVNGIEWGDTLVALFSTIPENLRNFYLLIQDDLKNEAQILDMMKTTEYSVGLYYLRIHARRNAQTNILVEMYDIFIAKHTSLADDSRAWEAIELGIAERHAIYYKQKNPLEIPGGNALLATMISLVDLFRGKGKTWIQKYSQPPAVSGVRFMSTILITHFGQSLLRSKETDLVGLSKSPLFKNPRGIKKNAYAKENILQLYSVAVGIYVSDPEKIRVEGLFKSLIEEYQHFNPSHN